MTDLHPLSNEPPSDAALVARLYELATELTRGNDFDRDEFARIDAIVYHRLAEVYGEEASSKPAASRPNPLNS